MSNLIGRIDSLLEGAGLFGPPPNPKVKAEATKWIESLLGSGSIKKWSPKWYQVELTDKTIKVYWQTALLPGYKYLYKFVIASSSHHNPTLHGTHSEDHEHAWKMLVVNGATGDAKKIDNVETARKEWRMLFQ